MIFHEGDRVRCVAPAWWGTGTVIRLDVWPRRKPVVVERDDGTRGWFEPWQVEPA